MISRKQILQKIKLFHDEVRSKRKNEPMRLQVDNEFRQIKIKDLNDESNVEMFTSSVRGEVGKGEGWGGWGETFIAEQKIRELKTRISKLNAQKLKITPTNIIQNSVLNMDNMKSIKYGLSPEEIERRSLAGKRFKAVFNMHSIVKLRNFMIDLTGMTRNATWPRERS